MRDAAQEYMSATHQLYIWVNFTDPLLRLCINNCDLYCIKILAFSGNTQKAKKGHPMMFKISTIPKVLNYVLSRQHQAKASIILLAVFPLVIRPFTPMFFLCSLKRDGG